MTQSGFNLCNVPNLRDHFSYYCKKTSHVSHGEWAKLLNKILRHRMINFGVYVYIKRVLS